jgi:hypothetical protein
MASTLKHLRSSTAEKRPTASGLADGQLAINTASGTPGLFFKDSANRVVKVGPVHVDATAPNASPAGSAGNSIGELWVNNSLSTPGLNYYTGAAFVNLTPSGTVSTPGLVELATDAETQAGTDTQRAVTPSGLQSKISDSVSTSSSTTIASATAVKTAYDLANIALPRTGGTVTGQILISPSGSLVFEGSTDDSFETTLAVVNPTSSDRTITLPDITGTVITNADTGTITSTMILDGTIVNGDINASAAIDLSKLATGALPSGITIASANIVDGTIVNADINASAAIVDTKLDTIATANKVSLSALDIDGATDIGAALADADLFVVDDGAGGTNRKAAASRITDYTFSKVSGDIAITSSGVASISAGVIVNADVNASAAIDHSKLANITAGSVLLGNASNVPTATAITGDISLTSGGVAAIAAGVIVDADINASAAISASKIQAASTSSSGVVTLIDSVSSTSTTAAATPNSVKTAYDLANGALARSGGTMTGAITFASGQTIAGYLPTSGGTLTGTVTFASGQTISGYAQLATAQSFTAGQRGAVVSIAGSGTVTINLALGNNFAATLSGNTTLALPSGMTAGQSGAIVLSQDGTGSRLVSYSGWKFPGGTAPTATTTASGVDIIAYYVESATRISARMINDVK